MRNKFSFLGVCLISVMLLNSCTKNKCSYDDYEWVYYDTLATDGLGYYSLSGHKCEYLVWVNNAKIFAQSRCTKRGNVINQFGEVLDTFQFKENDFPVFKAQDPTKKYAWQIWEYNVTMRDSTVFKDVKYISRPIESVKLFTRRSPKRELSISYSEEGKHRNLILKDIYIVHNIIQYDTTRFLLSIQNIYSEITPGKNNHYLLMLDLEDFTHKYFLGIKLW